MLKEQGRRHLRYDLGELSKTKQDYRLSVTKSLASMLCSQELCYNIREYLLCIEINIHR